LRKVVNHDPKDRLTSIQKRLAAALKPLSDLSRASVASAKGWTPLEQTLAKLTDIEPVFEEVRASLKELRDLRTEVDRSVSERFGSIEAAFVKDERSRGAHLRELGDAWQVGRFTLEIDRPKARARVVYNRQPVSDWRSVQSVDDLSGLLAQSERKLRDASIAPDRRDAFLVRAYQAAAEGHSTGRVSMPELFRAFRLELLADELSSGSPSKRVKSAEFPLWAFLAVLDGHRMEASAAGRRRLRLETGSQQDHSKGLAMVVQSGTDGDGHRTVCWAVGIE
jgi:hypothetical protein